MVLPSCNFIKSVVTSSFRKSGAIVLFIVFNIFISEVTDSVFICLLNFSWLKCVETGLLHTSTWLTSIFVYRLMCLLNRQCGKVFIFQTKIYLRTDIQNFNPGITFLYALPSYFMCHFNAKIKCPLGQPQKHGDSLECVWMKTINTVYSSFVLHTDIKFRNQMDLQLILFAIFPFARSGYSCYLKLLSPK